MSTSSDPILLLREVRKDVAAPSEQSELLARQAMFTKRPAPRRGAVAAVAFCVLAVLGVLAVALPWTHTESAEAAIDQLADTAAAQPTVKIGPDDWIITHYTRLSSWTQDLTQDGLDKLTAHAVAIAENPGNDGHRLRTRDGRPASEATAAKVNRTQQRRLDRLRAGVKLADLPTTHVVARNEAPYTEARDARGVGGGGGGSNKIEYGSSAQAASGKILERAGIGGRAANPTDFGGAEITSLPSRAVGNESDVEALSTEGSRMRAQLAKWKAVSGLAETPDSGSGLDIFAKVSGVVSSPYATPEQRATAIRLAASLPRVEIDQHARDAKGREGVGMALAIPGGTMQFVFSDDDSRLLGMLVKIDDPKAFVGDSYAGSGKHKVEVIPPYDSATIAVSFDKWTVSRGKPPCGPGFCMTGPNPSPEELARMRRLAETTRQGR